MKPFTSWMVAAARDRRPDEFARDLAGRVVAGLRISLVIRAGRHHRGRDLAQTSPSILVAWYALFPGMVLVALVLVLSLLGTSLSDALNPARRVLRRKPK